jgi:hypothetical protein
MSAMSAAQSGVVRYDAFARRITAGGVLTDPWVDGAARFREEPLVLDAGTRRALSRAAEEVAAVYHEK